jgi:L-seryl-tRNA(Ser) seleniumtransferase
VSPASLRAIPSVEKVLLALGEVDLPRAATVAVVRRELAGLRRKSNTKGKQKTIPDFDGVMRSVRGAIAALSASRIRPVLNATGIIIHTNFGRAPLATEAIIAAVAVGAQYNNLEYDLGGGARGGRAAYLEHNLALLCDTEAATVVNNNAAALVLILRHFCQATAAPGGAGPRGRRGGALRKNEVIISRGELVQIGGGFRIPEILESSGARLREIGTTNRTSLADYSRAISGATALILKVHHSNFFMGGFVESPLTEEISALARKKRIPFVEDLGSGAMIDTARIAGLEHEPTPAEVLGRGVDLVCFSGDKLLGGPQAGVIAGKAKLIAALKRDPFFRALRCDKLILSALQATVDIYLGGAVQSGAGIPVLEMLSSSTDSLRARAEKIVAALAGTPLKASVGEGRAQVGGGALPQSTIPSVTVDLTHQTLQPQEMSARLRARALPVIGYIERGKLKLDLRTIFPRQDGELVEAIRAVV